MQVIWTSPARSDLLEAFEYIIQDNPKAALSIVDRIEATVAHLAAHPKMGRAGRITGTYELVMIPTPYIVTYRIKAKRVEILAVIHASRKWPESV